jgi:hypothetical protein
VLYILIFGLQQRGQKIWVGFRCFRDLSTSWRFCSGFILDLRFRVAVGYCSSMFSSG